MLEHQILSMISERRFRFAIVCASSACPSLLEQAYIEQAYIEQAYIGHQVLSQLEKNTTDFFSRRKNCRFDYRRNAIRWLPILMWSSEDFGRDDASILVRIRDWLPAESRNELRIRTEPRIRQFQMFRCLDSDRGLNTQ